MRAITIDMVGSALKKSAQTRVRNPVVKPAAKRATNPTKMPGKSKTDIEAVKEYVRFFGLKISPKPGSEPIIGTKNAEWYKVFDSWKQAREFFHNCRVNHWDFGKPYPWDDVKNNPLRRGSGASKTAEKANRKSAIEAQQRFNAAPTRYKFFVLPTGPALKHWPAGWGGFPFETEKDARSSAQMLADFHGYQFGVYQSRR